MNYQDELGNWGEIILEPSGDTLPVGAITQFGGETAPTNWLFCNGQAVSRETYAELFEAIGTTYGEGDGSTTFNLPDFSSRSPMGVGTGTDGTNSETTTLGQEKGEYKHQLTVDEMPSHNHKLGTNINCTGFGTNNALARGTNGSFEDKEAQNYIRNRGGDQAHNTIHPVLGVNFIIKAKQSIGIVGTVSEDITDTNNNAVPTCETVKDYVDEKQTYSTEETVIGTWIDGKPIYRKVLNIGTADFYPSTDKYFTHDIDNLDTMLNINYSMYFPGDSSYYKQWDKIITVKSNSTRVSFTTGSISGTYIRFTNVKIVLEYTKTTD